MTRAAIVAAMVVYLTHFAVSAIINGQIAVAQAYGETK